MKIDEWHGAYPSKWKGMIVEDAISHPAKFSSKLISRIYEHMLAEGWLQPGDLVIDPFGGVALGALDAMRHGLRWRGVELEAKFAQLGNENIALWNKRFSVMPHWCQDAVLLRGDSRHLLEVLTGQAEGGVSSPPYADSMEKKGGIDPSKSEHSYGPHSQMANSNTSYSDVAKSAVSSPPWSDSLAQDNITDGRKELARELGISNSEHISPIDMEKIGKRPKGGYSGAVSSPPYADTPISAQGAGLDQEFNNSYRDFKRTGDHSAFQDAMNKEAQNAGYVTGMLSSPPYSEARIGQESGQEQCGRGDQYGPTEGQLGAMKAGGFDAAVTSPPFRQASGGANIPKGMEITDPGLIDRHSAGNMATHGYGETEGQLANMPEGDYDGAVTSPPYNKPMSQEHNGKRGGTRGITPSEPGAFVRYGNTEGQLEGLPNGNFDDAVSSPPGENSDSRKPGPALAQSSERHHVGTSHFKQDWEPSEENIASDSGDSFWLAARTIVEQVYLVLRPGGHAVWVVKGFVKDKAVVDFPGQWRQLCEAVGFVTVHEHHAMLTTHKGASHTLDGGIVEHMTESKSFFRRNGENKARAAKWWENTKLPKKKREEYIERARVLKQEAYEKDLAKYETAYATKKQEANAKKLVINPEYKPPRPPTENIILAKAQSIAWADAGSPQVEIETSIDYETVLCMVKPE